MYKTGETFYDLVGVLRYMICIQGIIVLNLQRCPRNDSWCFTQLLWVPLQSDLVLYSEGKTLQMGLGFLCQLVFHIQKAPLELACPICFFVTYMPTMSTCISNVLLTDMCTFSKGTHAWRVFRVCSVMLLSRFSTSHLLFSKIA
jgi:hypothetical protein